MALFEPSHREQVFSLYGDVFGNPAREAFEARWDWSQERNLYPGRTPKWVLLDGSRVVGFLATIPLPYMVAGRRVVAHTPSDYMVHPDYRFHGIRLMRQFMESLDCVSCDDIAATIRVTRWLGAIDVGAMVRHVRILDARALRSRPGWANIPGPALWAATQGLRLAGAARRERLPIRDTVHVATQFDHRFQRFFERMSRAVPAMPARDLAFLAWRYGEHSPHAGRHIGVISDPEDELAGYVVYHVAEQSRQGHILDLQVHPATDRSTASTLLGHAVDHLQDLGAWTARFHQMASPQRFSTEVLERWGFIPRGGYRVLVKFRDQDLASVASRQDGWNLVHGDTEASHSV